MKLPREIFKEIEAYKAALEHAKIEPLWHWIVMEGEVKEEDHLCGPECQLHKGNK